LDDGNKKEVRKGLRLLIDKIKMAKRKNFDILEIT
jgi:hypothetical protein